MQLTEYLTQLGEIWAKANNRSQATLGSKVVGESKFFDRLRAGTSCTAVTIEKLLSFFRDNKNWKDDCIPDSAVELLDKLSNISTGPSVSTGQDGEMSRDGAQT